MNSSQGLTISARHHTTRSLNGTTAYQGVSRFSRDYSVSQYSVRLYSYSLLLIGSEEVEDNRAVPGYEYESRGIQNPRSVELSR